MTFLIKNFKIFEMSGSPDLIMAVKSQNPIYVKKVIDSGADVNCKDHMDWTPLLWAAYYEQPVIIKMLINAGADMSYKTLHYINGTKKMVDFYDLCVDKGLYEGGYKRTIKWIEINYPEFVASKKYNI